MFHDCRKVLKCDIGFLLRKPNTLEDITMINGFDESGLWIYFVVHEIWLKMARFFRRQIIQLSF